MLISYRAPTLKPALRNSKDTLMKCLKLSLCRVVKS